MSWLLVALLFMQATAPARAYIYTDQDGPILATLSGRYRVEFGQGCDELPGLTNLELLPGSHDVGALAPIDSDVVCSIFVGERLSDEPCAQTDGVCDVNGR